MNLPKKWFTWVKEGDVKNVAIYLTRHVAQTRHTHDLKRDPYAVDIDEKNSEGNSSFELAYNGAYMTQDPTMLKQYCQIMLLLIAEGADLDGKYLFKGQELSLFQFACLSAKLPVVRLLADYCKTTPYTCMDLLKKEGNRQDIIDFLTNRTTPLLKPRDSYLGTWRSTSSEPEVGKKILEDYCAPGGLRWLLHPKRHSNNLQRARLHIDIMKQKTKDISLSEKYSKLPKKEQDALLFLDYLNELSSLNEYVVQGTSSGDINPKGTFVGIVRFLNKSLRSHINNERRRNTPPQDHYDQMDFYEPDVRFEAHNYYFM